jgi:hypothetical protein
MNQNRRKLMQMLPLAAVAGVAIKASGQEAQALEVASRRRYIFKMPNYATQADVKGLRATLDRRGFNDSLIVGSDIEIYEA